MRTKIFVINGAPTSGKSTFVSFCGEWCDWHDKVLYERSMADPAYDIFWYFDIDVSIKDTRFRNCAAELIDTLTKYYDVPFQTIKREINLYSNYEEDAPDFLFIHCRKPENIKRFVDEFGAKTIYIDNLKAKKKIYDRIYDDSNPVNEADFLACQEDLISKYDYYILNDCSFEEFNKRAHEFMDYVTEEEDNE